VQELPVGISSILTQSLRFSNEQFYFPLHVSSYEMITSSFK